MNNYEAMFIIKPDLSQPDAKKATDQINEIIAKNNGKVIDQAVWAEKRSLTFPIRKYKEGLYYLLNFSLLPAQLKEIRQAYKLNENILRVLILKK
jgi:small subunit ribosomal protein S6